jgi:hypothetical protein
MKPKRSGLALFFGGLAAMMLIMLMAVSCGPTPEQYAAATATLMAAQIEDANERLRYSLTVAAATESALYAPTVQALQVSGTVTALNVEQTRVAVAMTGTVSIMQATLVSVYQEAAATATAAPHQAGKSHAEATTNAFKWWAVAVILIAGGSAALVRLAWHTGSLLKREAMTVRRDALGNAPLLVDGNRITNPDVMVTPVLTTERQADWLWQLYRLWRLARSGEVLRNPGWTVEKNDEGVLPESYAALAERNAAARTMAAAMRPELDAKKKQERVRLLQKGQRGPAGLLGAPSVEVIANTEDAARVTREITTYLQRSPQAQAQVIDQPVPVRAETLPTEPLPQGAPTEIEIAERVKGLT